MNIVENANAKFAGVGTRNRQGIPPLRLRRLKYLLDREWEKLKGICKK
jgi:hypothetical protein